MHCGDLIRSAFALRDVHAKLGQGNARRHSCELRFDCGAMRCYNPDPCLKSFARPTEATTNQSPFFEPRGRS